MTIPDPRPDGNQGLSPCAAEERLQRLLLHLLAQSLLDWRVLARAELQPDGSIAISGLTARGTVRRARAGMPFRWLVDTGGRERPAVSIAGVLRQLRQALDPRFAGERLRIVVPLSSQADPE